MCEESDDVLWYVRFHTDAAEYPSFLEYYAMSSGY